MSITMIDEKLARIRSRSSNIRRYRRLLETELTDVERDFVVRRLSEEQEALSLLQNETFPMTIGPWVADQTVFQGPENGQRL